MLAPLAAACMQSTLARLQQPFPLEYIPVEVEYQSAASDYDTLAHSIFDIHRTHNFKGPPSIWRDMLRPIHVALVLCSSTRSQKGENQEGEDETNIDVDDMNGRRLSWHSDMDNGL
nr:augmin subunit 2-like [Tanacetum cinerariifolium]